MIEIKTTVNYPMDKVWEGFDQQLFEALSLPFPPVQVVRFDGCQEGDIVELELNFLLFKQRWQSIIIAQVSTAEEIYFIDKGAKLPFFLSYWQHKHKLVKIAPQQTIVVDEINFKTPFILTNYLLYPLIWLQFAYRKPIYKKFFSE